MLPGCARGKASRFTVNSDTFTAGSHLPRGPLRGGGSCSAELSTPAPVAAYLSLSRCLGVTLFPSFILDDEVSGLLVWTLLICLMRLHCTC